MEANQHPLIVPPQADNLAGLPAELQALCVPLAMRPSGHRCHGTAARRQAQRGGVSTRWMLCVCGRGRRCCCSFVVLPLARHDRPHAARVGPGGPGRRRGAGFAGAHLLRGGLGHGPGLRDRRAAGLPAGALQLRGQAVGGGGDQPAHRGAAHGGRHRPADRVRPALVRSARRWGRPGFASPTSCRASSSACSSSACPIW